MKNKRPDPWAAKLGLSEKEWSTFQGRLTHAVKAVEMLRAKLPEAFERLSGHPALDPATHTLSPDAQRWIDTIVADLLSVQNSRPRHRPKPAKAKLKSGPKVVSMLTARRKR